MRTMTVTLTIARPKQEEESSTKEAMNPLVSLLLFIFRDVIWEFVTQILAFFTYVATVVSDLKSGRGFQWFLAVSSFVLTLLIVLIPDEPWLITAYAFNPFLLINKAIDSAQILIETLDLAYYYRVFLKAYEVDLFLFGAIEDVARTYSIEFKIARDAALKMAILKEAEFETIHE